MRKWKKLNAIVALLATVGFVIPRPCLAQIPARQVSSAPPAKISDVVLDKDGALAGVVISAQGQPVPGAPIRISQGDVTLVNTSSDEKGRFNIRSLRGGGYQLAVGNQRLNMRIWAPGTAPPTATRGVTVVAGDVAHGQGCTAESCTGACGGMCGAGGPLSFLMHPLVIGAAVAAAIAIPLAVSNNDDDDNASL